MKSNWHYLHYFDKSRDFHLISPGPHKLVEKLYSYIITKIQLKIKMSTTKCQGWVCSSIHFFYPLRIFVAQWIDPIRMRVARVENSLPFILWKQFMTSDRNLNIRFNIILHGCTNKRFSLPAIPDVSKQIQTSQPQTSMEHMLKLRKHRVSCLFIWEWKFRTFICCSWNSTRFTLNPCRYKLVGTRY